MRRDDAIAMDLSLEEMEKTVFWSILMEWSGVVMFLNRAVMEGDGAVTGRVGRKRESRVLFGGRLKFVAEAEGDGLVWPTVSSIDI